MKHILSLCMCDECIRRRVRAEVERRDAEKEASAYVERRGGEPGTISVQEALKNDQRGDK